MAEKEKVTTIPMLENILAQPSSLKGVLAAQRSTDRMRACGRILNQASGQIFITGMGGSLAAAWAAASRLREQGVRVQLEESAELLHHGSAVFRANDVGVVISRSGESVEPVLLAEKMRQAGMAIVAVTNVPGSRLEALADATLHVGAQPDNIIAVQTYGGTLLSLLLLAEEVTSGSSALLADACQASLPILADWIEACLKASDEWQEWLIGSPLYLLGRGPALGSVYEGQLLMHETAKTAAVGMSAGQFRHGPAEILSGDLRAVVFGSATRTLALDQALARDLFMAGAKVRWIGPDAGGLPALVPWPQVPAGLEPLFEIVPLQVAAYRLALWRGLTPGDFRFVSEVTAAETGFLSSASAR